MKTNLSTYLRFENGRKQAKIVLQAKYRRASKYLCDSYKKVSSTSGKLNSQLRYYVHSSASHYIYVTIQSAQMPYSLYINSLNRPINITIRPHVLQAGSKMSSEFR